MLKRVQHDNRVGCLFCHPELVSGSRSRWVGEALGSLFKAPEVALIPYYSIGKKRLSVYTADEIAMDPDAVLGPVDPQLGNVAPGKGEK